MCLYVCIRFGFGELAPGNKSFVGHNHNHSDATSLTPTFTHNSIDKESRDLLLDLLLERVHDVTAYCRSRCLKTWIGLCERGAIPRTKLLPARDII